MLILLSYNKEGINWIDTTTLKYDIPVDAVYSASSEESPIAIGSNQMVYGTEAFIQKYGNYANDNGEVQTTIDRNRNSYIANIICESSKQYNPYTVFFGQVEKTWNNGMGSLTFITVLYQKRRLTVNLCLCNNSDLKNIIKFANQFKFEIIEFSYLRYPDYYTNGLRNMPVEVEVPIAELSTIKQINQLIREKQKANAESRDKNEKGRP